jgi:type II secretory pathway pseudopilin PulG
LSKKRLVKGFTVMEALAAAVLVGVGVTAGMSAIGSMSQTEIRMRESEKLSRLAHMKLDEIMALGNATNTDTDGDFEEYGEPNYEFTVEVQPSGIDSLDTILVTAKKSNSDTTSQEGRASGLLFTPPETTE